MPVNKKYGNFIKLPENNTFTVHFNDPSQMLWYVSYFRISRVLFDMRSRGFVTIATELICVRLLVT